MQRRVRRHGKSTRHRVRIPASRPNSLENLALGYPSGAYGLRQVALDVWDLGRQLLRFRGLNFERRACLHRLCCSRPSPRLPDDDRGAHSFDRCEEQVLWISRRPLLLEEDFSCRSCGSPGALFTRPHARRQVLRLCLLPRPLRSLPGRGAQVISHSE